MGPLTCLKTYTFTPNFQVVESMPGVVSIQDMEREQGGIDHRNRFSHLILVQWPVLAIR